MPDFRDFFDQQRGDNTADNEHTAELVRIKDELEKDAYIDIEADITMGYAKRQFDAAMRAGFQPSEAFDLTKLAYATMLQRGYI